MVVCYQTHARPPVPRHFIISRRVHIFQNQFGRIDPAPITWVYKIATKLLNRLRNFSHAPRQRGSNRLTTFAAVYCGQRLDPSVGSWNDGLPTRAQGTRKQPVEPFRRKVRQVAGENQIPSRESCGQCSGNSCQRPTPECSRPALCQRIVSDCAQSELRVSTRRS